MTQSSSTSPARRWVVAGRLVDVALLVVVAVGLTSVVLGRVLPALGHPVFVVAGPSMAPAIPVGAAVVLTPVAPGSLAVGDVVSLRSGPEQAVFTHRIIRVADHDGGRWIETKGDANPGPDPSVTSVTAVIGRVDVAIPYAGYALALLSTLSGLLLVLSAGATLLVLGWWLDTAAAARRVVTPASAPVAPVAVSTTSAADRVRADRSGRRRRARSDLARERS